MLVHESVERLIVELKACSITLFALSLLLLGERDDWEVDARLLEDGKHPLHLVQVAQTVSAARHEH